MRKTHYFLLGIFLTNLTPLAQAYVGPGAGLSAVGSILAFIGAILLLVIGFLWYPIKRVLGLNKKNTAVEDQAAMNKINPGDNMALESQTAKNEIDPSDKET